jgi:hypothetical protein
VKYKELIERNGKTLTIGRFLKIYPPYVWARYPVIFYVTATIWLRIIKFFCSFLFFFQKKEK